MSENNKFCAKVTVDGNTAVSNIAYAFSEVIAIYPITPASGMAELADEWATAKKENMFGTIPTVQEMQSEAGAIGTVHGSLVAGSITTTFTASQGLLLMIPNMYKIAGELLPCVIHVSARSIAAQALSIFGDHSDVMTTRMTGFALLGSSNVQEAQDMALIAHLSTLETRIPFLHFFDGFRTSHEIQKIDSIDYETIKSMVNWGSVSEFKSSAISPDKPYAKVGAQGPDVYFQGRETVNRFYDAVPSIVKKYMDLLCDKTGRRYELFEYFGHPKAEKLVIAMGSSADTIEETIEFLVNERKERVGFLKVRLFNPFSVEDFLAKVPESVRKIAVLDRTKEPGAIGEPLYLNVVSALKDRLGGVKGIKVVGGRYGLSSKEFTPSMVNSVFRHLESENCFHGFTVGINDDVTNLSIPVTEIIETDKAFNCQFWGYGSDGTVSATKNTIKIVGDLTSDYVQAYFSYDAKKSGGVTRSFIRMSPEKIRSTYLPTAFDYVALHKQSYIGRYDILKGIKQNGVFVLNTSSPKEQAFSVLTKDMQETIIRKNVSFYVIDASRISKEAGLSANIINTAMQTAFFSVTGLVSKEKALEYTKKYIEKQFVVEGRELIEKNIRAVEAAILGVSKVEVPRVTDLFSFAPMVKMIPDSVSGFARDVVLPTMIFEGDSIPVSKMTITGAIPTGTTKLEKRGVTLNVPKWLSPKCIQCGLCSFVCPNTSIRMKQILPSEVEGKNLPRGFDLLTSNTKNDRGLKFRVQVYPLDCVGCNLCANVCPVKALEMVSLESSVADGEKEREEFYASLSDDVLDGAPINSIKGTQFKTPLLEFASSCPGCGETPYVKLLTQMFGDNMIIANATGCSSIWGGTFPSIPYTKNKEGKGPAWANSLFEDNAEFGFGFRLSIDSKRRALRVLVERLLVTGTTLELREALSSLLKVWDSTGEDAKGCVKRVLEVLPSALSCVYGESEPVLRRIFELRDYLLNKSVWILGGDGWAYDIDFGGLDHVLAQGKRVKVLVLDTEVYSNTGGQASKSTPIGAMAKFASDGKKIGKKNLGLMMMSYGNIYVASVALGGNKQQLIDVFAEAEKFDGSALIIAYAPCIAHGTDMSHSIDEEKKAVETGYWPLYRFNPALASEGKHPFVWESPAPRGQFADFLSGETRFKSSKDAEKQTGIFKLAEEDAKRRFKNIKHEFSEDGES